jgi:hypothetical protein
VSQAVNPGFPSGELSMNTPLAIAVPGEITAEGES